MKITIFLSRELSSMICVSGLLAKRIEDAEKVNYVVFNCQRRIFLSVVHVKNRR